MLSEGRRRRSAGQLGRIRYVRERACRSYLGRWAAAWPGSMKERMRCVDGHPSMFTNAEVRRKSQPTRDWCGGSLTKQNFEMSPPKIIS